MPRKMVIGKLKYLIGPGSGFFPHALGTLFLMRSHAGASVVTTRRRPWRGPLVVEGGDPDPRVGKKGEMLRGDWVPMRVLRSAWPD